MRTARAKKRLYTKPSVLIAEEEMVYMETLQGQAGNGTAHLKPADLLYLQQEKQTEKLY